MTIAALIFSGIAVVIVLSAPFVGAWVDRSRTRRFAEEIEDGWDEKT